MVGPQGVPRVGRLSAKNRRLLANQLLTRAMAARGIDGRYVRIPPHGTPLAESLNPEEQEHPEDNWDWSPQGEVDMHLPSRWGWVVFE